MNIDEEDDFEIVAMAKGGMSYIITYSMDWLTNADLDIYVKNITDGGVCFFGATSIAGLTLNHDAHPACAPTPVTPETISGTFVSPKFFSVWRNQFSTCAAEQPPTASNLSIENTGGTTLAIVFNGGAPQPLLPGNTFTTVVSAYAGYGTGNQVGFLGGDTIFVS